MGSEQRIGEYKLGDILGKGAAGAVYRGLNLRTGEVVAIKQIRTEGFSSSVEIETARKEIDVLRDLNHHNIVKYIGYEQSEHELDIILEYCEGGSLQNILSKFSKFPENLVGVYVAQILDGLAYLHSNAILHRDIKPGNILLLKEGVVKLADFGVARIQNGLNTVVGSPYWIAPEVLLLNGATAASDIWSLGCTIVQLVSGKAPYQDLPPMTAMFRIGQDEHPPFPANISPLLRDFLSKCLVHVPSARATAEELRAHEWIHACLRERQGEGQISNNYERDIRTVAHWNQAVMNSSPRDVKRFSIGGGGNSSSSGNPAALNSGHSSYAHAGGVGQAHIGAGYANFSGSSSNLHASYGSARARDEIPGAILGMSSMGISHSGDGTTQRTVSSIAAYEEDSGDDWDNAFENLDTLKLKAKPRPLVAYPQAIVPPTSPGADPDPQEAADVHAYLPLPAERTMSESIPAQHQGGHQLSGQHHHGQVQQQLRSHTSPPSPRMWAQRRRALPGDYARAGHLAEDCDDADPGDGASCVYGAEAAAAAAAGSHMPVPALHYGGALDGRPESVAEALVRRTELGLRLDAPHPAPVHGSFGRVAHQRDGSHVSLEALPPAGAEGGSSRSSLGQAQQGRGPPQQQQQQQHQQQQRHVRPRQANNMPPGFPSRSSEERLRRETEIRWVQDIGAIVAQLRGITQEDVLVLRCQQAVGLLREGRGVFSASHDWRVRSVVDALRAHQGSSNAQRHLLVVVNRLCHMDAHYLRAFCLHGIIQLVLPMMRWPPRDAAGELQAEAAGLVSRLCRCEDPVPIRMLLACDAVSALCAEIGALVDLDVATGVAPMSRVLTSLVALIIAKGLPPELSAPDLGDLLAQAQAVPLLCRLLARYGEACQPPLPSAAQASSGRSSANGSDAGSGNGNGNGNGNGSGSGNGQQSPADRAYHGVCDVLMVACRLFNELVRRIDSLQDQICESGLLDAMFRHLHRYPRKAVVLAIHGVRFLSKNPASLDVLDRAGILSVSASLLASPAAHAYREYVMTTVLRVCSSSLERQQALATQHPELVAAAMEYAQVREAPTLSKYGRLIVLGLASGGAQCCRVLKEVDAFELVVKLISRERWCGMAIRALLDWTRTVPADIVPSLTGDGAAAGWGDLARPLLSLSTSSTTLDMYAATFYSLVRLYVPAFPRACMGDGEATGDCIWVRLMDRYLACSGLADGEAASEGRQPPHGPSAATAAAAAAAAANARPEVVAANHMNATTRLTFLNLLLVLQPYLRITTPDMQRRIDRYCNEMVLSSKLDAALPVRKASLELSLALERM
ncbi:Protein kinase of the Mitotic Exit Network [Coemansia javaensis]|uniref:Protein kinase of the Mitotic Exit Network n=1 Tax=Coemansia javaensis TaxID=2761396 RepID=A0A9W8H4B3_9FUNG|nr:Protein kinase of the Mitotic Exit Network [Coemansia javaensis]